MLSDEPTTTTTGVPWATPRERSLKEHTVRGVHLLTGWVGIPTLATPTSTCVDVQAA
jgi:hypothetical protein